MTEATPRAPDQRATLRHFAICPRGLETELAKELLAQGATDVDTTAGGASFDANLETAYRVNLHSRLASRVLRRVDSARYRNDDDLYKLAARTPWETLIDPALTLRVDVTAARSSVRSLNFATLRIKDGIVDRLRARTGARPSVDTRAPGTRVFGFLDERHLTLYLDLSGEPLFKRGWRSADEDKGDAPLKENLAAGLLALCGWTPEMPLYDPFCGSGTIVIEAAQIAARVPPGLSRNFGFEKLPDFDAALWQRLRGEALRAMSADRTVSASIAASDVDAEAIAQTRRNLRRAGVPDGLVKTAIGDFARATPPFETPGIVLANPPYDERIGFKDRHGRPAPGFEASAEGIRRQFAGWRLWLLSSDEALPRRLGMTPRRRTPLFNGAIACRLYCFEIFETRPRARTAS